MTTETETVSFPHALWIEVCATPAEAVARAVDNCGLHVHNPGRRYAHVRKHLCIGIRPCG